MNAGIGQQVAVSTLQLLLYRLIKSLPEEVWEGF